MGKYWQPVGNFWIFFAEFRIACYLLRVEQLLAVIMFGLANGMTPGPNNTLLMISGATWGFRATLPHLLGVVVGFPVMVFIVGLGLGRVLSQWPILHIVLKVACCLWLLLLAYKLLRSASPGEARQVGAKPISFWNAAAFQWVNPKALVMAVSSAALFIPVGSDMLHGISIVSLGFFLAAIPSAATWSVFGAMVSGLLNSEFRIRMFNILMTALLIISLVPVIF